MSDGFIRPRRVKPKDVDIGDGDLLPLRSLQRKPAEPKLEPEDAFRELAEGLATKARRLVVGPVAGGAASKALVDDAISKALDGLNPARRSQEYEYAVRQMEQTVRSFDRYAAANPGTSDSELVQELRRMGRAMGIPAAMLTEMASTVLDRRQQADIDYDTGRFTRVFDAAPSPSVTGAVPVTGMLADLKRSFGADVVLPEYPIRTVDTAKIGTTKIGDGGRANKNGRVYAYGKTSYSKPERILVEAKDLKEGDGLQNGTVLSVRPIPQWRGAGITVEQVMLKVRYQGAETEMTMAADTKMYVSRTPDLPITSSSRLEFVDNPGPEAARFAFTYNVTQSTMPLDANDWSRLIREAQARVAESKLLCFFQGSYPTAAAVVEKLSFSQPYITASVKVFSSGPGRLMAETVRVGEIGIRGEPRFEQWAGSMPRCFAGFDFEPAI